MIKLILIALYAFVTTATTTKLDSLPALWSTWKTKYRKSYSASEELERFGIFVENLAKIAKMNSKSTTAKFAINQFADLTSTEFSQLYANNNFNKKHSERFELTEITETKTNNDLPSHFDWRSKGAVTPVQDQGECGSSWAFAANTVIEGAYFIKHGQLISLSEQQLIDCSKSYGNLGCNGGLMINAYRYVIAKGGIVGEDDYPYTAEEGICQYDPSKIKAAIESYKLVTSRNSQALKAAIYEGPVSVAIDSSSLAFQFYYSGVLDVDCGIDLNHAVALVGYGDDVEGSGYFITKNSWGVDWGDRGYIKLSADQSINNGLGICGVLVIPETVKVF